MNDEFALDAQNALSQLQEQAAAQLAECNNLTGKYGLRLSDRQILGLLESRREALSQTGRIEFGEGVLKKLIEAFCDSPYVTQENYEETLAELQDAFYYFKNESLDSISDDELIGYMREHFDGECQGSLDYLSETTLEELCRRTRFGYEDEEGEEDEDDGDFFDDLL
jgi:hypothetical protein